MNPTTITLASRIAALPTMTLAQLRREYREVFGDDTLSRHKEYLWRKIAWGLQAREEGGLSAQAQQRARELADPLHLRAHPRLAAEAHSAGQPPDQDPPATARRSGTRDPHLPAPGTVLTRWYQGRQYAVRILEQGCEYDGVVYRSLTAVAKAITGGHWNGRAFFGLTGGTR